MKNCLVTKLKGVVDNDNLELLGGLSFYGTGGLRIGFENDGNKVITIINGVKTETPGAVVKDSIFNCPEFQMAEGTRLEIWQKYNLSMINSAATHSYLDINELNYMPSLRYFSYIPLSGDASQLKTQHPNCIYFYTNGEKLTGSLEKFAKAFSNVNHFQINNGYNITGSIEDLPVMPNLNKLTISSLQEVGSIETFVVNQRVGRPTCSGITWICNSSFDGDIIDVKTTVSWTASTITVGDKTIEA